MPSIVEILHDDAGDGAVAGNESKLALQSRSPKTADPTSALKSQTKATRRRITPMTDSSKQADGSHENNNNSKKKKHVKNQATLQSYFVKAPQTLSPSLNKNPKQKQPQTLEAAPVTTTHTKSSSPSPLRTDQPSSPFLVASNNKDKSSRHAKENFKAIVIGKLYERKSLSHQKSTPATKNDTPHDPSSIHHQGDIQNKNYLDSMLPTIRPLVTVLAESLATTTTALEMETAQSHDESDDSAPGYGELRSQLVQKFDAQTNQDTNEGSAVVEDPTITDNKDAAAAEIKEHEVECVHQEDDTNPDEASDPNSQAKETTMAIDAADDNNNVQENSKVDSDEVKKSLQESPLVHTTEPMDLTSSITAPLESNQELSKYEAMTRKYCFQISELVAVARQGLEDEDVVIPLPCTDNVTLGAPAEFPDIAVPHLVCLLEGRYAASAVTLLVVRNTCLVCLTDFLSSQQAPPFRTGKICLRHTEQGIPRCFLFPGCCVGQDKGDGITETLLEKPGNCVGSYWGQHSQ